MGGRQSVNVDSRQRSSSVLEPSAGTASASNGGASARFSSRSHRQRRRAADGTSNNSTTAANERDDDDEEAIVMDDDDDDEETEEELEAENQRRRRSVANRSSSTGQRAQTSLLDMLTAGFDEAMAAAVHGNAASNAPSTSGSHRSGVRILLSGRDIKCPVCQKRVNADDAEIHLVMCLTKPKLLYNDDVLLDDKGECAICLEEMLTGHTIARLPCLCIYHKRCIDRWFSHKNCCPEHPGDD